MKNPLKRILDKLRRKPEPLPKDPKLEQAIEVLNAPPPYIPPKPQGRVIKDIKKPEYNPVVVRRGGGRIVKVMPRQLQKIKQAQEKVDDDS